MSEMLTKQDVIVGMWKEGWSEAEIAKDLGMPVSAVGLTLELYSKEYADRKVKEKKVITDAELEQFVEEVKKIALAPIGGEVKPNVKLDALKWLMDEGTGRNDARVKNPNQNESSGVGMLIAALSEAKNKVAARMRLAQTEKVGYERPNVKTIDFEVDGGEK